jgi:hypothetical protein
MFLLKLARLQLFKHINYVYKLPDGELLSLSHRIINRKMYRFALKERKRGENETQGNE